MLYWIIVIIIVLLVLLLLDFSWRAYSITKCARIISRGSFPCSRLLKRLFTDVDKSKALANLEEVIGEVAQHQRFHALALVQEVIDRHFPNDQSPLDYAWWAKRFKVGNLEQLKAFIGAHSESNESLLRAFIKDESRKCWEVLEIALVAAGAIPRMKLGIVFELFVAADQRACGIVNQRKFKQTLSGFLSREGSKMSFQLPFLSALVTSYLTREEWKALSPKLKKSIQVGMIWFKMLNLERVPGRRWSILEGDVEDILSAAVIDPLAVDELSQSELVDILFGPERWLDGWEEFDRYHYQSDAGYPGIILRAVDSANKRELHQIGTIFTEMRSGVPPFLAHRLASAVGGAQE